MYYQKAAINNIYHVFNKSIAQYNIFSSSNSFRFVETLDYYNTTEVKKKLSLVKSKKEYQYTNLLFHRENAIIKILCYCIMPDHYHLLVKCLKNNLFSKYFSDVENSFTRYFNIKHNRKGPLWQNRFKRVRITNNEQLLHVSRYIHLNPTTNYLVDHPENWVMSSYRDYITNKSLLKDFLTEISIPSPISYKKFVNDNRDYQRKLKFIKSKIIE